MQQLGHQKGEIGLQGNFKHNKVSNANANLRDAVSGITLQLLCTQNERQKKKKSNCTCVPSTSRNESGLYNSVIAVPLTVSGGRLVQCL